MTKIVERDPDGVKTTIEYDEGEDRFVVGSHQDVRPVLDQVAARNNDGTGGWSPSRNYRLRASIPNALYDQWLREAYKKRIPIWNRQERDGFLKRKLAEHERLVVSAKKGGLLGAPSRAER